MNSLNQDFMLYFFSIALICADKAELITDFFCDVNVVMTLGLLMVPMISADKVYCNHINIRLILIFVQFRPPPPSGVEIVEILIRSKFNMNIVPYVYYREIYCVSDVLCNGFTCIVRYYTLGKRHTRQQ